MNHCSSISLDFKWSRIRLFSGKEKRNGLIIIAYLQFTRHKRESINIENFGLKSKTNIYPIIYLKYFHKHKFLNKYIFIF